jgi:hypothetical protein
VSEELDVEEDYVGLVSNFRLAVLDLVLISNLEISITFYQAYWACAL